MSCPDQEFADAIIEIYSVQLPHAPDRYLLRRAYLHAEFAIAQWLIRATEQRDQDTIREAVSMLEDLESDLRASGALDSPTTRPTTDGTSAHSESSSDKTSTRSDRGNDQPTSSVGVLVGAVASGSGSSRARVVDAPSEEPTPVPTSGHYRNREGRS